MRRVPIYPGLFEVPEIRRSAPLPEDGSIPGARYRYRGLERVDVQNRLVDDNASATGARSNNVVRVTSRTDWPGVPPLQMPMSHTPYRVRSFAETILERPPWKKGDR